MAKEVSLSMPQVKTHQVTPDEFLTTKELMALLKIKHRQTIYDLVKSGLPAIPIGRNYRFIKNEVIEYLRKRTK